MPPWTGCPDIVVPRVRDGILQYSLMELVAPNEPGKEWILRDKLNDPHPDCSVSEAIPLSRSAGMATRLEWSMDRS